MKKNWQKGQLTLEAILAAALFVIFSVSVVEVVLQGIDANRTSNETVIANSYASEGLEAVRSMKNQSFGNLISTTSAGLVRTGSNVWTFNSTSNIFTKYTRKIAVASVNRDSSGNIVASGGTLDPDTKKIISTVTWNVSPQRNSSIALTTYLTNWRATPPSCTVYCQGLGSYTVGNCRQNAAQCTVNGETHEVGGDTYCTGGPTGDFCCCK